MRHTCKGSFYDKLIFLLIDNGVSKKKFCEDLNIHINNFSNWKVGIIPKRRTVEAIAAYFMVVPESFMDPDREIEYFEGSEPFPQRDPLEDALLNMFRALEPDDQFSVLKYVKELYQKSE